MSTEQKHPCTTGGKNGKRPLTARQLRFCDLVAQGQSQTAAYRIAYKHPKMSPEDAGERGWRVAQNELVQARIAHLRSKVEIKTMLSVQDRMTILAKDAQTGGGSAADKNARARVIKVYNEMAGDNAPQRIELTGKDGAPIPLAATALVGRMTVREKIKALEAARLARGAA